MILTPETGLLAQACWTPSPNFDRRPAAQFVNTLVIHAISLPPGEFGGDCVESLFCNKLDTRQHPYFVQLEGLKVSSHFYIRRDGELQQFVATHNRAWHAGISSFYGLDCVNDFSIGIELEGDDLNVFSEQQYRQLSRLCKCLMISYPAISRQRITGHSDIAPQRKTDPGPLFDWPYFRKLLGE